MTECPVVHGVPTDRAHERQPEARKRNSWRGEVRDAAGHRRQRSDHAHHRVDDCGVPGDAETRANAPPDEQISGEAETTGDGEEVSAECTAVDAEVSRAGDDRAGDRERATREHLTRNTFSQQAFPEGGHDDRMQRHEEHARRHRCVLE